MKPSVFLSYANPFLKKQEQFISELSRHLGERGFATRTLGVTDYDMEAPLKAIRRLMIESNGLLAVAFKRNYIQIGTSKPNSDLNQKATDIGGNWTTSPYCQIEPAMAFQLGLPILIFREKGVIEEGLLEKGVLGTYMPSFDLETPIEDYFKESEFNELLKQWEGQVRSVIATKGQPPKLY